MANLEFFDALYVAGYEKNNLPLCRLLRANYPLSAQEKASLADLLEGKIKRRPGDESWKATDELTDPEGGAVRRGAYFFKVFQAADKAAGNPSKGRQKRAIQKTFEYMEKQGLRLPDENRLVNFLRRSQQARKKRSTKS
jgi:hypothetical protein